MKWGVPVDQFATSKAEQISDILVKERLSSPAFNYARDFVAMFEDDEGRKNAVTHIFKGVAENAGRNFGHAMRGFMSAFPEQRTDIFISAMNDFCKTGSQENSVKQEIVDVLTQQEDLDIQSISDEMSPQAQKRFFNFVNDILREDQAHEKIDPRVKEKMCAYINGKFETKDAGFAEVVPLNASVLES